MSKSQNISESRSEILSVLKIESDLFISQLVSLATIEISGGNDNGTLMKNWINNKILSCDDYIVIKGNNILIVLKMNIMDQTFN